MTAPGRSAGTAPARLAALVLVATACAEAPDGGSPPALRIERTTTLHGAGDSGHFAEYPFAVRRLRSGGFVVSPGPFAGRGDVLPRRFDRTGRFEATIGRIGDGPGEFRTPVAWGEIGGDTLLVADRTLRRVSAIGPGGVEARAFSMANDAEQLAVTSDGGLVVNVPYGAGGPGWTPLVRVDADGRVGATFGGDSAGCGRLCGILGLRLLAADGDGGVWTSRRVKDYLLDRYDRDGRATRHLRIDAEWFPRVDSFPPPPGDRFPYGIVNGIALDSAGRLWIVGSTADPDWKAGLGPELAGEGGTTSRPVADLVRYRDGVLDIRDTTTGALIAHRRFADSPVLLLIEPGLLAAVRTTDDGWREIDILRVSMDR